VASSISPGSVSSLPSPPDPREPISLVVRSASKASTPKHWKKYISRSYVGQENQENGGEVPPSLGSLRHLPPVAPSRPLSIPRIVQPWALSSTSTLCKSVADSTETPVYTMPVHVSPWYETSRLLPVALPLKPIPLHEIQSNGQNTVETFSSAIKLKKPYIAYAHEAIPIVTDQKLVIPTVKQETEVFKFQCMNCQKTFSTESGYQKHLHLHTNNQLTKDLSCPHCLKVYNSQSALKMHIRTHTLPCKCPECGKSFSRPWLLQGHMRTHSGEKPFSCTHCARTFADKSNLRAHLQTHLQNKKYSCPGCQRSFSRMGLLNKHTDAGCHGLQTRQEECVDALVSLSSGFMFS
jgi:hypothetical protein